MNKVFFLMVLLFSFNIFASIGLNIETTSQVNGEQINFKDKLVLSETNKPIILHPKESSSNFKLEVNVNKNFNLLPTNNDTYEITVNLKDKNSDNIISTSKIITKIDQEAVIKKANNTSLPAYDMEVSLKLQDEKDSNSFW